MTPRQQLLKALREIEQETDAARDAAGAAFVVLRDCGTPIADDDEHGHQSMRYLGRAVRLLALLQLFAGKASVEEIHSLFGAPGDWGYHTPLGDALYRLYSEKEAA
jgi:hypothetical protein